MLWKHTLLLMKMENVRILKGMSNYYNRQVNCEAANIKKTVNTACRQIDDIQYIIDKAGIDYLPGKLQDIAMVRLENPDSSLQELGGLLEPPLGKSGVNHRLRKISEIADDLRGNTPGRIRSMTTKDITIGIQTGLEARPVAVCVQVASQFQSKIYVEHGNVKVNAKSIMGMMTLGLASGETVTVTADGEDEVQAIDKIEEYLSNNAE